MVQAEGDVEQIIEADTSSHSFEPEGFSGMGGWSGLPMHASLRN
jgi:hypothetical protein